MDWQEARDGTLEVWRRIHDAIGTAEELDLLTEINAVCDLCEVATSEAAGRPDRCGYCLAFQQAGGCRSASLAMSEMVVDKDWDGLRGLVAEFISTLEAVDLPAEDSAAG